MIDPATYQLLHALAAKLEVIDARLVAMQRAFGDQAAVVSLFGEVAEQFRSGASFDDPRMQAAIDTLRQKAQALAAAVEANAG
jgi:hypothetical protein